MIVTGLVNRKLSLVSPNNMSGIRYQNIKFKGSVVEAVADFESQMSGLTVHK